MTTKPKTKLCWQCEGAVALQDENCKYCGVNLAPLNLGGSNGNSSLFAPPYRMDAKKEEAVVPSSPYVAEKIVPETLSAVSAESLAESSEKREVSLEEAKAILLPQLFLTLGLVLIPFSIALFLFSEKGVLTLVWSGFYWFVYLFFGCISLGVGIFLLRSVKD